MSKKLTDALSNAATQGAGLDAVPEFRKLVLNRFTDFLNQGLETLILDASPAIKGNEVLKINEPNNVRVEKHREKNTETETQPETPPAHEEDCGCEGEDSKLCQVKDLPLKKIEPIYVSSRIRIPLKNEDFSMLQPYDEQQKTKIGLDSVTEVLKDYAERNGETRYFYRPFVNNNTKEAVNVDRLKDVLYSRITQDLISSNFEEMDNEGLKAELIELKSKYLGWKLDTNTGDILFNNGSSYHYSSFDNFLYQFGNIREYINEVAENMIHELVQESNLGLFNLRYERNVLKTKLDNLHNTSDARSSMVKKLMNFYEKSLVHCVLTKKDTDRTKLKALTNIRDVYGNNLSSTFPGSFIMSFPSSKYSELIFNHPIVTTEPVKYMNGSSSTFTYVGESTDFNGFHSAITGLENEFNTAVKKLVEAVNEGFPSLGITTDNWHEFPSHIKFYVTPVFYNFVMKVIQDYSLENFTDQDRDLVAKYRSVTLSIQNIKNKIDQLTDTIGASFYLGWTEYFINYLQNTGRQAKIVPGNHLPLVLSQEMGPFGELPQNPYTLENVPNGREYDFYTKKASIGLVSQYGLEINHTGFGLGAHLYSQSLMPGEEVNIEMHSSVRSKKTVTKNSAEKIFEQTDSETQKDFQRELENKYNSTKSNKTTDHLSLKAELGGGPLESTGLSPSLSMEKKIDKEKSFSETIDSVDKTMDKLSQKLSNQRQVTLDTSKSETLEIETLDETKTVRKFANINKEKTLTINFFQITREYETSLFLRDIKFYYCSGRYELVRMFMPKSMTLGQVIADTRFDGLERNLQDRGLSFEMLANMGILSQLPSAVWDYFQDDAFVFILAPAYCDLLSLSQTNAYLLKYFTHEKAKEINREIWQYIGYGATAPDGLGIAAYPFSKSEMEEMVPDSWPKDKDGKLWPSVMINDNEVLADRYTLNGDDHHSMANIDLRYKDVNSIPLAYIDHTDKQEFSVPKRIYRKSQIINTNGVYAENMLGKCGALEKFATDHRRLDVEAKEIANKQANLMLPPDMEKFVKDGEIDFTNYSKAVEQYERIVKANKVPVVVDSSSDESSSN